MPPTRAALLPLASLLLFFSLTLLPACTDRAALPKSDTPLRVVVSIAPLKGLVQPLLPAIDGKPAELSLIIPVGASEHGYEIPASTIASIAKADLIILIGVGLEPSLERILKDQSVPGRQIVRFADCVGIKGEQAHEHDAHADHDHSGPDPHLWLDPSLVEDLIPAVAAAARRAVAERRPGATLSTDEIARLDQAQRDLLSRTRAVDTSYRTRLAPFRGGALVTAHAAWGRLTERYGLDQVPLLNMHAAEPTPDAIARAVDVIRSHGVRTIFTEPQLADAGVKRISEATGVAIARLDPLGSGDWFATMNANLEALAAGLTPPPAAPPTAPSVPEKAEKTP